MRGSPTTPRQIIYSQALLVLYILYPTEAMVVVREKKGKPWEDSERWLTLIVMEPNVCTSGNCGRAVKDGPDTHFPLSQAYFARFPSFHVTIISIVNCSKYNFLLNQKLCWVGLSDYFFSGRTHTLPLLVVSVCSPIDWLKLKVTAVITGIIQG